MSVQHCHLSEVAERGGCASELIRVEASERIRETIVNENSAIECEIN